MCVGYLDLRVILWICCSTWWLAGGRGGGSACICMHLRRSQRLQDPASLLRGNYSIDGTTALIQQCLGPVSRSILKLRNYLVPLFAYVKTKLNNLLRQSI